MEDPNPNKRDKNYDKLSGHIIGFKEKRSKRIENIKPLKELHPITESDTIEEFTEPLKRHKPVFKEINHEVLELPEYKLPLESSECKEPVIKENESLKYPLPLEPLEDKELIDQKELIAQMGALLKPEEPLEQKKLLDQKTREEYKTFLFKCPKPEDTCLKYGLPLDKIPVVFKKFRYLDKDLWSYCRTSGPFGIMLMHIPTGRPMGIWKGINKDDKHIGYIIQFRDNKEEKNTTANTDVTDMSIVYVLKLIHQEYTKYGKIKTYKEQSDIFIKFEKTAIHWFSGLIKFILPCYICKKKHSDVLYTPCQHQVYCGACFRKIRDSHKKEDKDKLKKCLKCGKNVRKIYFE